MITQVSFKLVGSLLTHFVKTPADYKIGHYTPGAVQIMSNGRPVTTATRSVPLKHFTLTWAPLLGGGWLDELEGAFTALCTGQTQFTDPNGDVWNVIRHPSQDRISFKARKGGPHSDMFLWSAELQMIENP